MPQRRLPSPSRVFFEPLQPFLIHRRADRPRHGRIARRSLASIWAWICRDLLPKEAKTYSDLTARAVLAEDHVCAHCLAAEFRERVTNTVRPGLGKSSTRGVIAYRLTEYMGPRRAIDDLDEMLRVFEVQDVFAALESSLPARIEAFTGEVIERTKAELDLLAGNQQAFAYSLLFVMARLQAPWQLVRLATSGAGGSARGATAPTPYGLAVGFVLADIEEMVTQLRADLHTRYAAPDLAAITSLAETLDKLVFELGRAADVPWAGKLTAISTAIANLARDCGATHHCQDVTAA